MFVEDFKNTKSLASARGWCHYLATKGQIFPQGGPNREIMPEGVCAGEGGRQIALHGPSLPSTPCKVTRALCLGGSKAQDGLFFFFFQPAER